MSAYKGWSLIDKLPDGWRIDKSAGSPLCGYEFCTNGKSVFNGQQRALVFVGKTATENKEQTHFIWKKEKEKENSVDPAYAKTLNELARKTFEQKMLNDILVDLMICEIEGWGKLDYIQSLKKSISGLLKNKEIKNIANNKTQICLTI